MYSRSRTPARRALATCCLLLAVVAWWPVDGAAAARLRSASRQSSSKEERFQRLNELAGAISRFRERLVSDPANAQLSGKLNAALSEYDSISASLGGDQAELTPTLPAGPGSGNRGGPTVPPGCMPGALGTGSNATPVAIPDSGGPVATSTIVIAGAGPYLLDLTMVTNITHTFSSDLDMTLQSPAGTIVTFSSDNGAGNDDVYAGTTWTDFANLGGQVPYTTNNGLVGDHAYVNLTVASPLAPEEAFAAFRGEDPNGTWTITIDDDTGGDTGTLNSWSLNIATLAAAPTNDPAVVAANMTPVAIPDSGGPVATSSVVIAGAGTYLCEVYLFTNLAHTFPNDLDVTLQSPAGTVVTLTSDNGGGNDNVFAGTTWDDDANPGGQVPYVNNAGLVTDHLYTNLVPVATLAPEEALGAFLGEDPNGVWTITLDDDLGGDTGTLNNWSLTIVTCQCVAAPTCSLTCPADVTATAADVNGAVVNYPAPTATNCSNVVCTPPSGSTFPVGTTVVTCTGDDGGGTKVQGVPLTCDEDFDGVTAPALPADWTAATALDCAASNPWATTASGFDTAPNAATVNNANCISDELLDSPAIAVVSPAATVSFRNNFNLEANFDGGVLEISIGGGPFTDILAAGGSFALGGYTSTISSSFGSPIGGRQAWSGNSGGFITTTVNLPAAANGQNVVLRFRRATDSSLGNTGWTIDSITTTGTDCSGGGGGGSSSCQFNVTVTIPFDACCVDDASGDIFRHVVASVPSSSPLYGYWEYEVAATGEIFAGTALRVAYRPGLTIIMDDNDETTLFLHAEIDFIRNKCRVQVRDQTTGRNFVLRDRNLNNNTCTTTPPPS